MSVLDWLVLGGTLLFIVGYGTWRTRRADHTMDSYHLGDRQAQWWGIGLSIIATQASAITFLSTPGQAYDDGMRFIQFYFGLPLAMVLIAVFAVPIYLYTFRGGLKTILWTDTFQTMAMLVCVAVSIYLMADELNLGFAQVVKTVKESSMSKIYFSDPKDSKFFWKQFASGAFITIVMTGLDQDLMQKNLSCRNLQDAQKNMFWFTIALVGVNILFLSLGVLLYQFAAAKGIVLPTNPATGAVIGDKVFPLLATKHFSLFAGIVFILGIIAVTYASADSALTALTTSFCVDMLDIKQYDEKKQTRVRQYTHFGFSLVLIVIILIFQAINDQSVVTSLFKAAGYTYGPLLGLYSFGIFTSRGLHDKLVLPVCLFTPLLTYFINANSKTWWGYEFGFEILILNGLLTFIGLLAISRPRVASELNPAA